MTEQQVVSLKPSDMFTTQFGDDIDAEVVGAQFVQRPYKEDDSTAEKFIFLEIAYESDALERVMSQIYKCGNPEFFQLSDIEPREGVETVSPTSETLIPLGNRTSLADNCSAGIWITQLVRAGVDESKITGEASSFVGIKGHLNSVEQGKFKDGKPYSVLLFTSTVSDEEAPKGKDKPKARGKGKAAKAAEPDDDGLNEAAQELVMEILADADGAISHAKLKQLVFKTASKKKELAPQRQDLMGLVHTKEFIDAGPWDVDEKGNLSL